MIKETEQLKLNILNKIKKYETIIIHRHVNADPDAIGSQVGLAEIIRETYPNKRVLTAGQGVKDLLFLATFTKVEETEYNDALVIVTDTANISRIDGKDQAFKGKELIKIDHHPLDDSYGDVEWVNSHASSCSEMITEFYVTFKDELKMSDNAARLLYGGIVGDTGRFQYPATTPKTMRLTAELMEHDFDHSDLLNQLYEMSPAVASLTGYVLENLTVEDGVGSIIITQELMNKLGIDESSTRAVVTTPGSIQGVQCWGVFVEQKDKSFRCRLRSKGPIINTIAKEHDGGGHPLASGANAYSLEEIETIIFKFKDAVKEFNK